ncbi:hypothetical protein [Parafrankia sp. EUN1f]|uniref:hypothetical protein n=1 Tax=Parafrankia sp. EUN1f TaxID=102897 RepID=UPI0001C44AC5|nr:hypothetical protein [Parafrankia sp. EUN1f]EFC83775.1 hypothetical protein FrEUN1fDRAFT_3135 [Parafrankia sp. EUN1f]
MTAWSDQPFPRIVDYPAVRRREREISPGAGESQVIYEIQGCSGWLAKIYKPGMAPDDDDLDRLISLPGRLSQDERDLVDASTSWPVARIVDAGRTVGVVLPLAPSGYSGHLSRNGKKIATTEIFAVDMLCQSEQWQTSRGLRVPSSAGRRAIGLLIARIGALFEDAGIVYGDWSYRNALWNPSSDGIYIIDMDSCRFGSRPWVESTGWEDPQVPSGPMDNTTDRYRVGLLVARVLTGERSLVELPMALSRLEPGDPAAAVLVAMTNSQRPKQTRPAIRKLVAALTGDRADSAEAPSKPAVKSGTRPDAKSRPTASPPTAPTTATSATSPTTATSATAPTTSGPHVTNWRPVNRPRERGSPPGTSSNRPPPVTPVPPITPVPPVPPTTVTSPGRTSRATPTPPNVPGQPARPTIRPTARPTGQASSRLPQPPPPPINLGGAVAAAFGLLLIVGFAVALIATLLM